ncbi:hypothetical protein AAFF_G00055500 [Aldrovandia affinis]|uniref:Uncharacterized protein n=1 Tax=Aldrovandia affinis TaxID=143900 RepID=A0AAD7WE67_9TELE|nr:hypothetical protein AAFF_G00055500 [Aldrovandia affinis]
MSIWNLVTARDCSAVETVRRKVPFYTPDGYYTHVRVARRNKPYLVHELGHNYFLDFKSCLNHTIKNRGKDEEERAVRWQKIKWLRYLKDEPHTIFFKYDFSEREFRKLKVAQQAARGRHCVTNPSPIYQRPPGISAEKEKKVLLCTN